MVTMWVILMMNFGWRVEYPGEGSRRGCWGNKAIEMVRVDGVYRSAWSFWLRGFVACVGRGGLLGLGLGVGFGEALRCRMLDL